MEYLYSEYKFDFFLWNIMGTESTTIFYLKKYTWFLLTEKEESKVAKFYYRKKETEMANSNVNSSFQ